MPQSNPETGLPLKTQLVFIAAGFFLLPLVYLVDILLRAPGILFTAFVFIAMGSFIAIPLLLVWERLKLMNPISQEVKLVLTGIFLSVFVMVAFTLFAYRPVYNPYPPYGPGLLMSKLKEIQSKGYGTTAAARAVFSEGTLITAKQLVVDIPIRPENVVFACSDNSLCGPGGPIDAESSQLKVLINAEPYVVACGDASNSVPPKYCIALSSTAGGATDECKRSCQLE